MEKRGEEFGIQEAGRAAAYVDGVYKLGLSADLGRGYLRNGASAGAPESSCWIARM